jgi:paraquat-inducible protein B
MTEPQNNTSEDEVAGVDVSQRTGFSIIWVIPLVALAIGIWMSVSAYVEKGPLVTIEFKTASGVVAKKTKVRMNDVEIGVVESVTLSEDLERVIIKARLSKESEKMLVEGSRFWIESPRISATEVKGLQTILSGVFIGIEPAKGGKAKYEFIGLEEPPFITNERGRYFILHAEHRGSVQKNSPIIYRGLDVGEVVRYKMNDEGTSIDITVFIREPFSNYVNLNTRFWESSGIEVILSADGLEVEAESVVTILAGGISFGTPDHLGKGEAAPENHEFVMFDDQGLAFNQVRDKNSVLLYFNGSVRGLKVGAPVEFRGIKIGEVVSFRLQIIAEDFSIRIPVLVELEKGHFEIIGEGDRSTIERNAGGRMATIQRLVDNGVRAQLNTGNLLTGALYVELDVHKDAPPAQVTMENGLLVVPTVPTAIDAITTGIKTVLNKISAMPLEQIGQDLGGAIKKARELLESEEIEGAIHSLDSALNEVESFTKNLNTKIVPQADATLRELKNASRSIKAMADYLERHPEALIKGKAGGR